MATTPEHLTAEQQERRREHDASFRAARRRAADPEFVAMISDRIAEMDAAPRPTPMSREEFLAATERK